MINSYLRNAFKDKSPWIQKHHIDKALNSDDWIREQAIRHPNATKEHIDKAINDPNPWVKFEAFHHPNATKSQIEHARFHDDHPNVRARASRLMELYRYKD